ncbi:tetratricopeptide repeat protein [Blastopirellula sp. JC732]|uniref:Tetratricopeptide repeat protein n=1 Tax=Blastopirellula sediminis TaxID=2894196 RepID=A0A9X1MUM1_9BACT|nr:tetratricopeptide repeat protein [Blastopirellula sediminis]MCC9604792.1 tetratricopeptide repeat protein [Blastopirellula sediminis]MCC9631909.1 tetratricopeptide repeat protein [Blastopirellula sediminis]
MRFSFVSLLLAALFSSLAIAHEYKVGDRVMVIADAKLAAAGRGETDEVFLGLFLDVNAVNNKWLWVGQGKPGWLDKKNVIPAADAFDYLTKRYSREKSNKQVMLALAFLWEERQELDIAISLYNDLIKLDPRNAIYFNNRGICWKDKDEYDKAIADFNQAIKLDPENTFAALNRGTAWYGKGEYDKAIADYNEAIKIDPKDAAAYNNLAWLQATCPNPIYLDGQQAIINAKKALELTAQKDANCVGTLAAAYAEAGDFAAAVKWQTKAQDMYSSDDKSKWGFLLDLYKSGKPYRKTLD